MQCEALPVDMQATLSYTAFSPLHLDITGEAHLVLDEEFMEFVVPFLEDTT